MNSIVGKPVNSGWKRVINRRLVVASSLLIAGLFHFSASAQLIGTIGVGDINFDKVDANKLQSSDPAIERNIVSAFNNHLYTALINTRKFTVVDHAALSERVEKQGLTLQGFYDKAYKSTELSQAGLDHILTIDVVNAAVSEKSRGANKDSIGFIDLNFELLGVAHATNDFASNLSAQAVVKVPASGVLKGAELQHKSALMDQAVQNAVDKLINQVVSHLHPIRIMKIAEDSAITLNYGKGMLNVGDTILVYPNDVPLQLKANGVPMVDAIATLQVTNTERKFATAQALDGFSNLEKGQQTRIVLSGG